MEKGKWVKVYCTNRREGKSGHQNYHRPINSSNALDLEKFLFAKPYAGKHKSHISLPSWDST